MLDRVVEHEGFSHAPLPSRCSDPESASRRDDERQVTDQARVGDARMRRNSRTWREQRVHRIGRRAGHLRLRELAEYVHGARAVARIRFDPFPVLKQMDGGPLGALVELLPLPQRNPVGILDVGHHLGRFGGDEGIEFRADFGGRLLKPVELWKGASVVELDLRKARIVKLGRFLVEMTGTP